MPHRRSSLRFSLLLALPWLVASCASTPAHAPTGAPLEPLSSFPVNYRSTLAVEGLASTAVHGTEPASEELPQIEVRAWRIELPTERARTLARGNDRWFHGSRIASAELERRLRELAEEADVRVDVLPRFFVHEGGSGSVNSTTQTAFLERYEIKNDGNVLPGLVADPVVSVMQEGTRFVLSLDPGAASEPLALRFHWESVTSQGEPARARGYLPGLPETLEIQLPVFTNQVLSGATTVGPGEGLLIGPAPVNDGQRAEALVILARRVGPRTAAR